MPPALSYCVVNTNGRDYLLACLAAIEATHPERVEREILVLDNASTDGTREILAELGFDEDRTIALKIEGGVKVVRYPDLAAKIEAQEAWLAQATAGLSEFG